MKHCTAAIQDYDKVIELDPYNALAYCNRGFVKEFLKQYNDAREDYQKALTLAEQSGNEALNEEIIDLIRKTVS